MKILHEHSISLGIAQVAKSTSGLVTISCGELSMLKSSYLPSQPNLLLIFLVRRNGELTEHRARKPTILSYRTPLTVALQTLHPNLGTGRNNYLTVFESAIFHFILLIIHKFSYFSSTSYHLWLFFSNLSTIALLVSSKKTKIACSEALPLIRGALVRQCHRAWRV